MAPRYLVGRKKNQTFKRYIKFLAVNTDKKISKQIIKTAPDKVIKAICNAAVNAQHGDIALSKSQKKIFHTNRKLFQLLNTRSIPIEKKRHAIVQKGGVAILPILLTTALGALGSYFMSKQ